MATTPSTLTTANIHNNINLTNNINPSKGNTPRPLRSAVVSQATRDQSCPRRSGYEEGLAEKHVSAEGPSATATKVRRRRQDQRHLTNHTDQRRHGHPKAPSGPGRCGSLM
ncbi:hypothetical protein PG994_007909 [Apiospora phragmitis]|uniref:Uncharacterized protein n=1 Tax=Apiospora phragmitis TaxID=2905665 RepID=A0ABR1URI9_9PEZI